jgi:hypothetical protein
VRIPPAAHTNQRDLGTVDRVEEDKLFGLESFASRGGFLAKTHAYQLHLNLAPTNSHRQNLSMRQIIDRLVPRASRKLCPLLPIFLDYYLNGLEGYDVSRLPEREELPPSRLTSRGKPRSSRVTSRGEFRSSQVTQDIFP